MSAAGDDDLRLTVERDTREEVRVRARGELDLGTAARLESCLDGLSGAGAAVVLDLRELTFMDSTGVRTLLQWSEAANREGRTVSIVAPVGGGALMTLQETGVLSVLPMASGPAGDGA